MKHCRSEWMRALMLACLGVILAGLFGCAAEPVKKKNTANLMWPMPPEQPRIRFIAEYHGQNDLSAKNELKAFLLDEDEPDRALQRPYGVTASADGKLIYATDIKLNTVLIFDLAKKEVRPLKTDAYGVMYKPQEIRIDSQGRIFVSDSERKKVLVLSPEGKTLMVLGDNEKIARPAGLALDEAHNRLYVADTAKHRVLVYDLTGKYLLTFGERGSEPGQFNYPIGLVVDRDGNLLVTDSGNFRVQILDSEGKPLKTIGKLGDGYGNFSRPKGIAVDSDNNIYVVDAAFNNFQIFNRKGQLLLFVGNLGREPGMLWLPTDIFVDNADRIYVMDPGNARVQVFQYLKEKKEEAAVTEK